MTRGRAALLVIGVFLLGLVGGWALGRLSAGARGRSPWTHGKGRFFSSPDSLCQERLVQRFTKELDLTPEQREQFVRMLDEGAERMNAFRKQIRSGFAEQRAHFEAQVREILDESQWRRFEEVSERHRRAGRERKEHSKRKEEE